MKALNTYLEGLLDPSNKTNTLNPFEDARADKTKQLALWDSLSKKYKRGSISDEMKKIQFTMSDRSILSLVIPLYTLQLKFGEMFMVIRAWVDGDWEIQSLDYMPKSSISKSLQRLNVPTKEVSDVLKQIAPDITKNGLITKLDAYINPKGKFMLHRDEMIKKIEKLKI